MQIKRMTAKGELVIDVVAGDIVARLSGEEVGRTITKIPAVQGPTGLITGKIGVCAVYASEIKTINAACAPFEARAAIQSRLDGGQFPGSKRAIANNQAEADLVAFDAAHPEVRAELEAARVCLPTLND